MYQRILAPLDGSQLAECTLAHVRAVAKGCKVPEVDLLFVVEPIPSRPDMSTLPENLRVQGEERYETWGKDYIAKTEESLKKEGIAAKGVILKGNAAEKILEYAKQNNVDLIIMATHGRSGPSRWAFGSVADRVIRGTAATVLVATPRGCKIS